MCLVNEFQFGAVYIITMTNTEIKTELTQKLLQTGREGIENTLQYLNDCDFFSTGCHSHHRYYGGLAKHSLETYRYALTHNSDGLPEESIVIASLLHDVCSSHSYAARDIHRHGSRSVKILERLCRLKLTQSEREAILHHMHRNADEMQTNSLARLIFRADKVSAAGKVRL